MLDRVRAAVRPGERVLVLLDSNHTKAHVLAELEAYAPLVSVGSYLVATDGVMADVAGLPGAQAGLGVGQPAGRRPGSSPRRTRGSGWRTRRSLFNEGAVTDRVTYWPSAYLKRVA